MLAEKMHDVRLPRDIFNLTYAPYGFGDEPLARQPDVNLISLTDQTETKKRLMQVGAVTLDRFAMELGGELPAIIFADAAPDPTSEGRPTHPPARSRAYDYELHRACARVIAISGRVTDDAAFAWGKNTEALDALR